MHERVIWIGRELTKGATWLLAVFLLVGCTIHTINGPLTDTEIVEALVAYVRLAGILAVFVTPFLWSDYAEKLKQEDIGK